MARIVVVGAGMGGLAVAVRLAVQGHTVTVLEQAETVGGKLGCFSRDGFTFDTGPSLLTLPAIYRDLFMKTGAPLEDVVELVPVDPVCHYRYADGTEFDLPNASAPAIRRAFDGALGEGAGADWDRFMQRAHGIWQATRAPVLESPLAGLRDLVSKGRRLDDLMTVAPWRTLRDLGRRYLHDPRLRMFLDRYATYTGSDPRRAPGALAVIPYIEQTFGAWYICGGMYRLAEALAIRAIERGVHIRTGTDVTGIVLEAGHASGVRLADGSVLPADVVVSNADATHLYRELVASPSALSRLEKGTPSLSAFVMMLAMRERASGQPHHTVLFPADYDAEFDAIFGPRAQPVPDPAIYICAPNDPKLRPDDDAEAWFVLVNAPRHGAGNGAVDWDADGLAESYADRVLAVMAERGYEVRHRLLWREIRTPANLARATRAPGGAIYGTSSNGGRSAFLRPSNRSPIPGLFLVGGSAHPGGGLPLVGLSAAIVADLIGTA